MVDAMRGHPENRAAFEGEGGADCHRVFEPLGNL